VDCCNDFSIGIEREGSDRAALKRTGITRRVQYFPYQKFSKMPLRSLRDAAWCAESPAQPGFPGSRVVVDDAKSQGRKLK
jgi:hypothetical protein